ncbi:MAG: NAD(P)/FAD-dependent oxidoreductase [Sphingomonadaceae bacterium]|nr:NAD(P)/FAD-dependent oxidoreductase [Sphingomonadaceae bacterium]
MDFDELGRKYEEERQKRLRSDALGQYQSLSGKFADFGVDPNAGEAPGRDRVVRDADVLIIGGGYGGLLSGAHLRQNGVEDIVIVDKAADFGGTWYWNRYPGIRCDVESYVYIPLLEQTGFIPSEKYAKGAEIYDQCQRIGERFELYRDALFQTEVESFSWSEERQRWIVRTTRDDEIAARFVISCTGHYSKPKLPGIAGIESFEGHSFHTSRWDYSYTGGNADGNLTGLKGKKVGVIGTGSTGIQCVPPLADWAEQLTLFQRTPISIDTRGNRPTDMDWARSQEPGWQKERIENFTYWTSGIQHGENLVSDSWTNLLSEPSSVAGGVVEEVDPMEMQRAEIAKMESVRRRVEEVVEDEATAEALKPYYHYFCKRPGFSDNYLQTFNRPNVTLVDTDGKGVERITPKGVVVSGKEYELDCLVYATGFDFMTSYTKETGLTITGRGGISLDDHWSHGARTLWGMQTRGFPNFFLMSLVQSGVSINYNHIAEAQTAYIAAVIAHCIDKGIGNVEPTKDAEDSWVDRIVELSGPRQAFLEACTPGYFNYEGEYREEYALNTSFGGGPHEYLALLEKAIKGAFADNLEFTERAES